MNKTEEAGQTCLPARQGQQAGKIEMVISDNGTVELDRGKGTEFKIVFEA